MNKYEFMSDKQFTFGALLLISNKMDTLLERDLKELGITTKQWFLLVLIESVFENPPTIKEAAREMGSSHQNIKQVALKLQEKGLLELFKDKNDARITRLKTTDKCSQLWDQTKVKEEKFTQALFNDISDEDLRTARLALEKLIKNLEIDEGGKI